MEDPIVLHSERSNADPSVNCIVSRGLARLIESESSSAVVQQIRHPWQFEPDLIYELSPREVEVFILLGLGFSNARIGRILGVTERTVKTHVGRVLHKLHLESRLQVGLAAMTHIADTQAPNEFERGA